MTPCLICLERDPMVGYQVCGRDKQNLAAQLADLLDLYAQTELELQPGSGNGRGTERPIGLRVSALNQLAGHDLLGVMGEWERDWRETFELAPPPTRWRFDLTGRALRVLPVPATLAEIVGFLLAWLDHACRHHPAIDEFAREVREAHSALRASARVAQPATYRVPCPADHGHGDCGHFLRVNPDLDELVDCRGCGTTWTTRRLLLVAAHDSASEIWLDVAAMAEITGQPERTLRHWAQVGIVAREHGRYSLGSVRAAMMGDVG